MRRLLIIILFILPAIIFSQTKKDNLIIVKGISFDTVVNTLLDNGYFIEQKDMKDGTIITKPKPVNYANSGKARYEATTMILYIRVKDSIAKIIGY